MLLTHPLLQALAKQVDEKFSSLRWIDLYAAQYVADLFHSPAVSSRRGRTAPIIKGKTADLFEMIEDDIAECELVLDDLLVLTLMCSYLVSQGQTFLSLRALPQEIVSNAVLCGYRPGYHSVEELLAGLQRLEQPDLLRVAGPAESDVPECTGLPLESEQALAKTPLVLWQDRLYLAKYWMLQQRLEAWLHSRRHYIQPLPSELITPLAKMLRVLFKLDQNLPEDAEPDWQAVAVAHTLINPFSLITGGPGTGKTTTAARLLCLLIYQHQLRFNGFKGGGFNIHLLAPTGKAAVRLAESIRSQLVEIESSCQKQGLMIGNLRSCLPASGETVHRFLYRLGGLRDTIATPGAFRIDDLLSKRYQSGSIVDDRQPYLDVIIVDESSMMDLALMVELVSLIPAHAKLILMGDHYQLPAVDPGQVFADCVARFSCQQASEEALSVLRSLTGFSGNVLIASRHAAAPELGFQPLCQLHKTYRFDGDLKHAADYIKQGDLQAFSLHFRFQSHTFNASSKVFWHTLLSQQHPDYAAMAEAYHAYFSAVSRKADLSELAMLFGDYQLLSSTIEGPLGVEALNRFIEHRFYEDWHADGRVFSMKSNKVLYHGKAILVTRNHPHLGIFNGDIGFVIEEQDGHLNVHFPDADQSVKVIAPGRIGEWQTAYAMTVHKSQGSEYRRVGVVLADYARELLTRSLLYTALTRSKECCDIWASEDALKKAMSSEQSGLSP